MALTLITGSIKNTNIHRDNKETWVGKGCVKGKWEGLLMGCGSSFGSQVTLELVGGISCMLCLYQMPPPTPM